MQISDRDKLLWENAHKYRLHQDNLRWTLLAGYAAFLSTMLALHKDSPPKAELMILVFAAGVCYMFVLGVENFFYNLFSEYVKDCEKNLSKAHQLRTLGEFASKNGSTVGPFHHSYFFALLIVSFGNLAIASKIESTPIRISLALLGVASFLFLLLGWRRFVYPYVIRWFQKLFDLPEDHR